MDALPYEQREDVIQLLYAYADFWKAHALRHIRTPFTFDEVRPLLERAAIIVVRIRGHVQSSQLVHLEGRAHEYLLSLRVSPLQYPERFVRTLVHATLQMSSGYTLGLSPDIVNTLFDKMDPAAAATAPASASSAEAASLRRAHAQLVSAFGAACAAVGPLLAVDAESFAATHKARDVSALHAMAATLSSAAHTARLFLQGGVPGARYGHHGRHRHRGHRRGARVRPGAGGRARGVGAGAEGDDDDDSCLHETMDDACRAGPDAGPSAAVPGEGEGDVLSTASTAGSNPWTLHDSSDDDGGWDGAPAAHSAAYSLEVERVEEDVQEIHERMERLGRVLDVVDARVEEAGSTDRSAGAMVGVLLNRCQAYLDRLLHDLQSVQKLHMGHDAEAAEVHRLEDVAREVVLMAQRLSNMGYDLGQAEPVEGNDVYAGRGAAPAAPAATSTPAPPTEAAGVVAAGEGQRVFETIVALFRQLRLEPRVDIRVDSEAYTLQTYLPGLDESDVKLTVTPNRIFVLQGFLGPSPIQLAAMLRMAAGGPVETLRTRLLQLAAGQFGTFAELFSLPSDVIIASISGSFEGGLLTVKMPRTARDPPATPHTSPRDSEGEATKLLHTPFVSAGPRRRAIFRRRSARGRAGHRNIISSDPADDITVVPYPGTGDAAPDSTPAAPDTTPAAPAEASGAEGAAAAAADASAKDE